MRIALIVGVTVVIAAVVAGAVMGVSVHIGPVYSVCSRDDEIRDTERAAIVRQAQEFVALVRSGAPEAVRNAMSSEARQKTELQAIEAAQRSARSSSSGADVSVKEVYRLFAPLGSREGMALCGAPSNPSMVARHGGTNVALVVFSEPLNGAGREWTVYLEREAGAWRVRHFHFGLSEIAGRDGAVFRNLAREQAQAGNTFNTAILYQMATLLLDRGESYQPASQYGLAQERSSAEQNPDISGRAPFTFHLGDRSFAVSAVTVTGTGDQQTVLVLAQPGEPTTETAAAERNRELIDAMNSERSEWRAVFDALVVSYPTSATTTWRTVYTRGGGYLPEPEAGNQN